jgi:hypothetical protein
MHGSFVDRIHPYEVEDWSVTEGAGITFPKSYVRCSLCSTELSNLKHIYSSLYPAIESKDIDLNTTVRKYSSVVYRGRSFRSNSIIFASDLPQQALSGNASADTKLRPVILRYLVLHAFHYNGSTRQHVFAAVSWLKEHHAKENFGKPLQVWWKELYDSNLGMFIPVQLLFSHVVHCDIKYEEQTVCLICPVHHIPAI